MEYKKISVIIPVYNGEKYLEKTLISLVQQTLESVEIVCVNNASSDNSRNILIAFKEAFPDKFLIVDSEKNRGPGGGRNIGLSYAKGEYIAFLDQDDIPSRDMYEKLYKEAATAKYDIVSCGFFDKRRGLAYLPADIRGSVSDKDKIVLCNDITYVWNKIFKNTFLKKMSCFFRENRFDDDIDFCIEAYLRCSTISYVAECLHTYNVTNDSTTAKIYKDIINLNKYIDDVSDLFISLNKRITAAGYLENISEICDFTCSLSRTLYFLFMLFSLKEFDRNIFYKFDSIISMVKRDYYNKKFSGSGLHVMIWNQLTSDRDKSFQNLIDLKKRIMMGEFDG